MRKSRSLHGNQGEITVQDDFPQPPDLDVVQRPLTFQPGKGSLHSLPLTVQRLELHRCLCWSHPRSIPLVSLVRENDRRRAVLLVKQSLELDVEIRWVRHHVLRVPGMSEPGFRHQVGGPDRVVDIPGAHAGSDRKLVLCVDQEMQFIAVDELRVLSVWKSESGGLGVRVGTPT